MDLQNRDGMDRREETITLAGTVSISADSPRHLEWRTQLLQAAFRLPSIHVSTLRATVTPGVLRG